MCTTIRLQTQGHIVIANLMAKDYQIQVVLIDSSNLNITMQLLSKVLCNSYTMATEDLPDIR